MANKENIRKVINAIKANPKFRMSSPDNCVMGTAVAAGLYEYDRDISDDIIWAFARFCGIRDSTAKSIYKSYNGYNPKYEGDATRAQIIKRLNGLR